MCFNSLYIYSRFVYYKFAIYLSLFVSMKCLKKVEENFFFLFNCTFLSDDIVMCLCCAQAVYYSSFTMLCIWPVGCVLRELYSQSALQMSKPPSELWYKCLVQYILLFNEKKKEWRWRRLEVRGRTVKRKPLNNCWTLLTSWPSWISKHIIILTFLYSVYRWMKDQHRN